jgi:hypothetical protein
MIEPKGRPLFLQLGRAGDIFNSLPLAERIFRESGERPIYMVAEAFVGLLDGVSYVEPAVYRGPFEEFIPAMFEARKLTDNITVGQIYGKGLANAQSCISFDRESWCSANASVPWGTLPLTIDRRDADREAELLRRCGLDPARKLVLLNLDGISSPFPYARGLREALVRDLPAGFQVLDMTPIRVNRLYDLLALYDLAHCLVTIDTGTLHLAHATPQLPVVSLVNPYPTDWHASSWRPSHVARLFYNEVPQALIDGTLVERIVNARDVRTLPRIIHVWADFRKDEKPDHENLRRMRNARASWDQEYTFAPGRWHRAEFPSGRARTSLEVGDTHPVPFVPDLMNHGVPYCRQDSDIIAWSNADVSFAPGLTGQVLEKCARYGAAFTHRWDFPALSKPFVTEAMVRRGKWYPGSDAFFCTLGWWKAHGHDCPDLLMGREHNDEVFRSLIKLTAGVECEIEAAIYHEKHRSFWEAEENFKTNPGNIWNRKLAAEWYHRHGLKFEDFKHWTKRVDRATR